MKYIIVLIISSLLIFSCEDVIDVNLPKSKQRLVIDASINWEKGTNGKQQSIKLSLTNAYYDERILPANNANVSIKNSKGSTFKFYEFNNSGIYTCNNFEVLLDETYTLNISYDNEVYQASETLKSVSPIEFVKQKSNGGFNGKTIELKAFYNDPKNVQNYYQFEFYKNRAFNLPFVDVYQDKYRDGNTIFAFYTNEKLKSGDTIDIKNYGISKQYFEFMKLLLEQGNNTAGGPFQTRPATVRGNCINTTNQENYPFGYFKLSEVTTFNYIVK